MTKVAIIDMGTNTFHLLIAEIRKGTYDILYRDHEPVKIGRNGINDSIITPDACERAMAAMRRFKKSVDENTVSTVLAFGTSAMRNSRNGTELAGEITRDTGIRVRIISGDEEADLIFEGIRAALDLGEKNNLIVDIGAGSVEFIIGNATGLSWKKSFEIGGQRLLEKFQKHDPITNQEITALDTYFRETLHPLITALQRFQPEMLIGSSGTFDTLSEIFCVRRGIPQTPEASETPLSLEGFYEIYGELIHKNREERMKIKGMIEMRVDMIVVACCLVRFVLQQHAFNGIRVSTYSLKEGVLATIAAGRVKFE